ncbi:MAG TPA: hypothetical protein ENO21_02535, partial [Firmicutes bacterium]|nr:hypothetical protein [Bacillota bacterium]
MFDLTATVLDPDGPPDGVGGGELPPTGIELRWTERLIGDYDQNGEVNYSDITPLGLHFNSLVEYDDPAMHGGFAEWPTGDPDDTGNPGDTGCETPLAVHWMERLSGYRVYRKAPGETAFSVVALDGSPIGYTLAHPTPAPANEPVRYAITDGEPSHSVAQAASLRPVPVGTRSRPGLQDREAGRLPAPLEGKWTSHSAKSTSALEPGTYAYYVAPYDAQSDTEGPPSAVIYIDTTTQVVNRSPVARLSVSPGFAGAPAEITLDASASYDLDGTIAAYMWDFDADGTPDWLSTDPVPETSSDGIVSTIAPGVDGVVTVTYNQGNAEWYYPTVVAIDQLGASSQSSNAKLGISGWKKELLFSPSESLVSFSNIPALGLDPSTGEVVIAATQAYTWLGPSLGKGPYFWRCTGPETWEREQIIDETDEQWRDGWEYAIVEGDLQLVWDENNRPLVLAAVSNGSSWAPSQRLVAFRRNGPDDWQYERLLDDMSVDNGTPVLDDSGRYGLLVKEITKYSTPTGGTPIWLTQVLWYDHGTWKLERTDWSSEDQLFMRQLRQAPNGQVQALLAGTYPCDFSLQLAVQQDFEDWGFVREDNGELVGRGISAYARDFIYDMYGNLTFSVVHRPDSNYRFNLSLWTETQDHALSEVGVREGVDDPGPVGSLRPFLSGYCVAYEDSREAPKEGRLSVYFSIFSGSQVIN